MPSSSLKLFSLVTFFITSYYLFVINNSLPFMTVDDLNSILLSFSDVYTNVFVNGRVSQLTGWLIGDTLSFHTPTTIHLIPRFLAMISLYIAISVYLGGIYKNYYYANIIASITVLGHLVDWQHNGMVAFYGSYNVVFSAFLLALSLANNPVQKHRSITIPVATVLFYLSFSSEVFVGISVLILSLYIYTDKRLTKRIIPLSISLSLYLLVFLIVNLYFKIEVSTGDRERMVTYLVGSLHGDYSLLDMLKGWALYTYNSLPLVPFNIHQGHFIHYLLVFPVIWALLHFSLKGSKSQNTRTSEAIFLSLTLIFVPNFLLVLQPMKLEWVLSGNSLRYVFSYYSWIGFVMISSILVHQIRRKNEAITLIATSLLCTVIIVGSVQESLSFVKKYSLSMDNWRRLDTILTTSNNVTVTIGDEFLHHPYITAVSEVYLQNYARKFYGKDLIIISDPKQGYDFGPFVPRFIKNISGLSTAEDNGRWSDSSNITIIFNDILPDSFKLKIDVSDVFGPNREKEFVIKVGNWQRNFYAHPGLKLEFDVEPDVTTDTIVINIPQPTKPREYSGGDDWRDLGIKLSHISFVEK